MLYILFPINFIVLWVMFCFLHGLIFPFILHIGWCQCKYIRYLYIESWKICFLLIIILIFGVDLVLCNQSVSGQQFSNCLLPTT